MLTSILLDHSANAHPDLISLISNCLNRRIDLRPDANRARKITDATLKMCVIKLYTNNLLEKKYCAFSAGKSTNKKSKISVKIFSNIVFSQINKLVG